MGTTSKRVGSLRLRAIEAEATADGASLKTTRPLADYFGTPRAPQVSKVKQGRRVGIADRV